MFLLKPDSSGDSAIVSSGKMGLLPLGKASRRKSNATYFPRPHDIPPSIQTFQDKMPILTFP